MANALAMGRMHELPYQALETEHGSISRPRPPVARSSAHREAIKAALKAVETPDNARLPHTTGWTRELRIHSLGRPAVLAPPEEENEAGTAIGAARAQMAREETL